MITEFRRLVFSSSDLIDAIKAFDTQKAPKLPDGDIVGVTIVGESDLRARIEMANIRSGLENQEIEVEANYLAAAMLLRCMQCGIPIPKSAVKTLERVDGGLALSLTINAAPQPVDPPDD
jgi:hypothetical protein